MVAAAEQDEYTSAMIAARTGEGMSRSALAFRDAFVIEYIKDFNGAAALMRVGVIYDKPKYYRDRSWNLLREPYVANKIDELVRQLKESDVVTRQQVMARMWQEANDYENEGSVRVKALSHVANMLGMMKPKEDVKQVAIGVMLVPCTPGDDWALMAQASQASLKAAAAGALPAPEPITVDV